MPIIRNNSYYTGTSATTSTGASTYIAEYNSFADPYTYEMYRDAQLTRYIHREQAVPAKPKKKTFEEKLQSEIDHWLSEFD